MFSFLPRERRRRRRKNGRKRALSFSSIRRRSSCVFEEDRLFPTHVSSYIDQWTLSWGGVCRLRVFFISSPWTRWMNSTDCRISRPSSSDWLVLCPSRGGARRRRMKLRHTSFSPRSSPSCQVSFASCPLFAFLLRQNKRSSCPVLSFFLCPPKLPLLPVLKNFEKRSFPSYSF